RQIRSEVLGALCTGDVEGWDVHPRGGVRLRGARISGRLDLARADLGSCPLELAVCELPEGVSLAQGSAGPLRFESCRISDLDADELDCTSSLYLGDSRLGALVLTDARVRGVIQATRAKLTNPGGRALSGDGLSAAGVFLRNVEATGEVGLPGAQIGSQLDCTGAKLTNPEGRALSGDGLSAAGVFLGNVEA